MTKRREIPDECPDCESTRVHRGRSLPGLIFGALLVLFGFLAFFPTLGVSFIAAIFGVFMMVPRHRCDECGWSRRAL